MAKLFEKDIKALTQRHYNILSLYYKGMSNKDIAKEVGIGYRQLSLLVNSPSFKHELSLRRAASQEREDQREEQREDEVIKTLRENTKKAVEKLVSHVENEDSKISLKASMEILDRAGYAKKEDKSSQQNGMKIVIDEKNAQIIVETITMINTN